LLVLAQAGPATTDAPAKAEMKAKAAKAAPVDPSTIAAAPGGGKVWVHTSTKAFHREGDEWHGKAKHGQCMTEADAAKAGRHAAKTRQWASRRMTRSKTRSKTRSRTQASGDRPAAEVGIKPGGGWPHLY